MLEKILVPIMFVGAQFMISWYGYFTGKLPVKGTYLGIAYDSAFARMVFVQLEYLWVLILINIIFSLGFHFGFAGYKSYLTIAVIWLGSAAFATLLFNWLVAKESLDWPIVVGILLVTIGMIGVTAHKEIVELFAK